MSENVARAAAAIRRGGVVALTGAGVSVESGLPDFRSPGGLWARHDVNEVASLAGFLRDPDRVWRFTAELLTESRTARPNEGHRALARLEAAGLLTGVVTQNIDGLHQAAGSRAVIEFHGSLHQAVCLGCGLERPVTAEDESGTVPVCPGCCRGLKPGFVMFGEAIPPAARERAFELAAGCRVMLVAGTAAEVAPASLLPVVARQAGAMVIEINLEPTRLTSEGVSQLLLRGPFGRLMPEVAVQALGE